MPRREMKKSDIHDVIYQVCLVGSVATLPYSRWLSSFSIIVVCINWIIEGNFKAKAFALRQNKLAMLMLAFFTCTAAGLLNTHDFSNCAFDLQKKLAFLAMGIVLGSTKVYDQFKLRRLFYFFTLAVIGATIFCFTVACLHYKQDHLQENFFYQVLGQPLNFHAVYFSIWVLLSISFLLAEIISSQLTRKKLTLFLILLFWLSGFLFLLSSKMAIGLFLIVLLLFFAFKFREIYSVKPVLIFGVLIFATCGILLSTQNPINSRFQDIRVQRLNLLQDNSAISPSTYFDGLSFRLLLWKFGVSILSDHHAWITGVTAGDAQQLLNEKIVSANLYTGYSGGRNGYLNYNFHNQFVESSVQSGLVCLMILLAIFCFQFIISFHQRDLLFAIFLILFGSFMLSESALERQMGVIPFALFSMSFINCYSICTVRKRKRD